MKEDNHYKNLINRIPIGTYLFLSSPDGSMRFDFVSPKFCQIYDIAAEEFLHDPSLAFSVTHPDDNESLIATNKYATETGESFHWEGRYVVNDKIIWVEISSEPSLLSNGDILWSGIIRDITERKESEEDSIRLQHELQQANEELERLSQIDVLTNVHNRRYLDEHIDLNWREHSRNGLPLSVMMIDIDYFKKFNDTYGHHAGDTCLCQVAQALESSLNRPTDILARYGGEEFCVIISGDAGEAMKVAELLCQAVKNLNIEHKLSDKGIVSISIGLNSTIPSKNDEFSEFIKQADQALYKSKETGRDTVTAYS